jgi:ABC-type histidine transport system ATPase subunit
MPHTEASSAPGTGSKAGTGSAPQRDESREVVVKVVDLHKSFGKLEVLKGVNLEVHYGDVVSVLGSSGSGKSTLLRCINYLERPSSGEVYVSGEPVGFRIDERGVRRPASQRTINRCRQNIGFVFQQFNVWPHMTVLENIMEAPVHAKRLPVAQAREIADRMLARVNLQDKRDVYPAKLSGGQTQRVAIARALAMEPKVMLFDEPTSALDPELIGEVLDTMKQLALDGTTMIVVTHEIGFAREVSDRIIFLHDGRIEEEGPPGQVIDNPTSERCRQFFSRLLSHR